MTDINKGPRIAALRDLQDSLEQHRRARLLDIPVPKPQLPPAQPQAKPKQQSKSAASTSPSRLSAFARRIGGIFARPGWRKLFFVAGAGGAVIAAGCALMLWRLNSGPISLDIATPFVASALEENFGKRHKIAIGGTQIELDETGHTSLRIRDIMVRDADGAVVASAPKAEIAMSGASLLIGSLRITRVSLVGAELAVRIETDGQITISTGAERRPIAVTPAIVKPAPPGSPHAPHAAAAAAILSGTEKLAALFSWIDSMGSSGLDGQGLGEIGVKNGSVVVDDQRTGKQWAFEEINLSVNRPRQGGVVITLGSDNTERPWMLAAAVTPSGYQRRQVQIEARKVSTKDILFATRFDDGQFQVDVPLSGVVRAEIGPDLVPRLVEGRIIADAGWIGDPDNPDNIVPIDKAEISLDWDAARKSLVAPFQIVSGANRITLLSQFEAPREPEAPWRATLTGGSMVLTGGQNEDEPLVLNRILVRAALDMNAKRIAIEQGELGSNSMSLAISGSIDFSGPEPRLTGGLAGTQMSGLTAKRIWPAFIAPKVRHWVMQNFNGGTVERLLVAANAPMDTLKEGGRAIPDDGMSVEVVVTNGTVRPIDGLPAIREADLTTKITGRSATVSVGRGTVELPSGRKLTLTNGLFEIPDHYPKAPPSRTRFRVDGPVQAAAELLSMDRLREAAAPPFDPASSRGTVSGQISLTLPVAKELPPGSTSYNINIDLNNFGADKAVLGQKIEAQSLRVVATNQGYQIRGDVRVNGTPAVLDYRKGRNDADAEIRLQATLDDNARARLGFDAGSGISGPVPVKLAGRISPDKDSRVTIDADFSQARIENLLPGWTKAAGRPARASFSFVDKGATKRFEDLSIDGGGVQVKGNVEIAENGDLLAANFPVFALSEGDKASLRVDRGPDGALRVALRGDVYDGRGFVKSSLGNTAADQKARKPVDDIDLDVRLGAVVGFSGEALRGAELRMSKRGGAIRSLSFNSKIGRDTPLTADMRVRTDQRASGRQVIYLETADAGALFRFIDMYPKMFGGQMWLAIDPPAKDQTQQEGIVNIRDFAVRGEAALDRIASQSQSANPNGVEFSRMRIDFLRQPGRVSFREGLVRGPVVGATMDGTIDYARNEVHMRGTFVPLYGINNAFGQIPIVGLFLGGGSNEGLLGITYEVIGSPGAPVLRVNPISAVAPGMLRKFFEFPGERMPEPNANATR